jgi:hypothetical protein
VRPIVVTAMDQNGRRLGPAHRRLFAFLAVATFFDGYDFFALSQVLPRVRAPLTPEHHPDAHRNRPDAVYEASEGDVGSGNAPRGGGGNEGLIGGLRKLVASGSFHAPSSRRAG